MGEWLKVADCIIGAGRVSQQKGCLSLKREVYLWSQPGGGGGGGDHTLLWRFLQGTMKIEAHLVSRVAFFSLAVSS